MTAQLPLPFVYNPALGRADFLISGCNEAALGWIDRWPDWPGRILVLHGPAGSGKTHLSRLWIERSAGELVPGDALAAWEPDRLATFPAVALDDAETAVEQDLLHLYNCCTEERTWLMVVARAAPTQWPISLPDLASRLRAAPAAAIKAPDEHLLAALIVKHLADRRQLIKPNVVEFLLRRMERSFAAAGVLAHRLDRLSMAEGGPITLSLARQALAETEAGA
jgi:chromosomal replication initiation ATPase DnaA